MSIEKQIEKTLLEETGIHMLDSGGKMGRHWQMNKAFKELGGSFESKARLLVEPYFSSDSQDFELSFQLDVYHFLTSMLETDDFTDFLNKTLEKVAEQNPRDSWLTIEEKVIHNLISQGILSEYSKNDSWNTYNHDSMLSQVLQGHNIQKEGFSQSDYPEYLFLQIHQGADVRGGYTRPRAYRYRDFTYFVLAENDIYATCKICNASWSTDDQGYHWYESCPPELNLNTKQVDLEGEETEDPENPPWGPMDHEEVKTQWELSPDAESFTGYNAETNSPVRHKKCGGTISFFPSLEF